MRQIGMLFVCLLATACGGKSSGPSQPAPTETAEPDPTTAMPEPTTPEPTPEPEPAPPPEPPAPPPVVATAELKAVKGDTSMGTITFEKDPEGKVVINGQFTGLKKKAVNAFYIHEGADCKKPGGHLNPTKAKHGPPASSIRHAGDFGNLTADDTGAATFAMTTDSVTLEADRPDSVVNRVIAIHAKKDDKAGSGGAVLACGVIQLKAAE